MTAASEHPRRANARLRVVANGVGWVLAFCAPVLLHAWTEARTELALADAAAAEEDLDAEIEHLGRALRWRVPWADHDAQALDRLFAIGEAAESAGDVGSALAAYREARGALLATRVIVVPHADARAELDRRIAALMTVQQRELEPDLASDDGEARHLALLQETPGPDPWRASAAALALLGWVLASAAVLWRGLDARGRVRPRAALLWGVGSLACMIAWMILWRLAG